MTVGSLNLPLPLGFRGLDPDLPIALYHRNLPHWRQTGATYFVTFRQADALPQEKLRWLKRLREEWERTHPPPRSDTDWRTYARVRILRTMARSRIRRVSLSPQALVRGPEQAASSLPGSALLALVLGHHAEPLSCGASTVPGICAGGLTRCDKGCYGPICQCRIGQDRSAMGRGEL